jgi:transcription elongation factor Elf1
LKSLEGAPKEVSGYFNCDSCKSLKSLEGAPEKVERWFSCRYCGTKFSEDDVKNVSKVSGDINC